MANEEAERESLMRRQVGNWSGNGASNAVPLSTANSRGLQFQSQILGQPGMQQTPQTGNALQQWRPPSAPFVDSAVADAAAAVAAARSRISQNHQQGQRTDPTVYGGANPTAAAAVLARINQQPGISNPQPGIPNPQPNPLMHSSSLPDDPWKAMAARPQFHLPSMPFIPPAVPPVRPPTTILGPQMPTPFPGGVPQFRPPFTGTPPPPSRPSLITDQPRLAALMAEYSNRLASTNPMMPPRPPLPPVRPVYPTNPIRPTYPAPRPVIPNLGVPMNMPMNLQAKPPMWPGAVPPALVRSNSAPPIPPQYFNPLLHFGHVPYSDLVGLGVPMGAPMAYPAPDQMFAPEQCAPEEGQTPETEKEEGKEESEAREAREAREEELKQQQRAVSRDSVRVRASASHGDAEREAVAHRRHQSASRSRSHAAKSLRSRRPVETSDEDLPTHRKFVVSDSPSDDLAEHLIVDDDPVDLIEHKLAVPDVVEHSVADPDIDHKPADRNTVEPKSVDRDTSEHKAVDRDVVEHELIDVVEQSFDQDAIVPANPTESRNVVISEFNRHAALVEDTVETVSEDSPASNKHRKVATQRNPRRRAVLRPTLSNSALTTNTRAFGHNSPAVSSVPGSNPSDSNSQIVTVHFEDPPDPKKSPSDPQKSPSGEGPSKPGLPYCIPSFFPPFPRATFSVIMSLQYAKFVIVLGLVLPLSELLSPYIRPYSYQAFYLYLYLGSILFMVYINISAAWRRRVRLSIEKRKASGDAGPATGRSLCHTASRLSRLPRLRFKRDRSEFEDVRYGSVYLRVGVSAFGIGSMVYCGLEVAREIEQWSLASAPHPLVGHVERPVRLLLPACRAALTILQMHFILFNDKASEIRRQRTPARVGLAHMIATNVCEWLGVVVQETRHEIIQLGEMGITTAKASRLLAKEGFGMGNTTIISDNPNSTSEHGIVGPLLHTVAPLLSPCTIEYSLICAVLLFEMWKEVGQAEEDGSSTAQESQSVSSAGGTNIIGDSPVVGALAAAGATAAIAGPSYQGGGGRTRGAHHLSADLTHSQRGAFCGVLLLVLTLLGVALLSAQRSLSIGVIADPNKAALVQIPFDAVLEAILSTTVLLGVIVVAIATRKLAFDNVPAYPLPLDLFLLVAAQTSAYVYSLFVIIGCYVLLRNSEEPVAVHHHAAVIMAVEALSTLRAYAQTHMIVRAWHRRPADARQANEKPGRQAVTFLLFANLCLWAASTFGSARAQRLPHHMRLFGVLPWTAIAHACLPLTIFLHLHSSICLFEMWKNCYKFRPD